LIAKFSLKMDANKREYKSWFSGNATQCAPASALRIGMHDIFAPEGVFVLFDFAELTVRFKK